MGAELFTITKQQCESFIRNLKLSNEIDERLRAKGINVPHSPLLDFATAVLLRKDQEDNMAKKSKGRGGKKC